MAPPEVRPYELPERVRFTLCPRDAEPIARYNACWTDCGNECWLEATGPFEPVDGPESGPRT